MHLYFSVAFKKKVSFLDFWSLYTSIKKGLDHFIYLIPAKLHALQIVLNDEIPLKQWTDGSQKGNYCVIFYPNSYPTFSREEH